VRGSPIRRPGDGLPVQIRRLAYPDLPQVVAIERRVFPTPWSLAMFVLELSKQTGICLAATEQGGLAPETGDREGEEQRSTGPPAEAEGDRERLVGYLICSRYDTVWHLMNVAVDADRQRMGLASSLLAELYARVDDEEARFTLEVRRSNLIAIHLYEREGFRAAGVRRRYYQDNGEDALVMWRTPSTLGERLGGDGSGSWVGQLGDVPNPGPV
jgi:[ribosomal protein S18]-alanine N-acetyltransferase